MIINRPPFFINVFEIDILNTILNTVFEILQTEIVPNKECAISDDPQRDRRLFVALGAFCRLFSEVHRSGKNLQKSTF